MINKNIITMYMYKNTHINQVVLKTKVLTKPHEIITGMMGKEFTEEFQALLFVMKQNSSSFWMKNCIVSLDIIFIQNDKIAKIHHNCIPCKSNEECKLYKGNGNLVLEVPGGMCKKVNIKKGDAVSFTPI
jgi:uncharacterized membrane protein (UPF0127 family)